MRCPSCGSLDTQVKDSRPTEDSAVIRRRRVCLTCNFRFTTFERVQLRELTVIKRNGRRVPFDRDKLMRSVQVALRKRAVDPERIEQEVSKIVRELESQGENEVSSEAIGELVMEHLRELDDVAYVRFASVYRNFREAKDFRAALDELSGEDEAKPADRAQMSLHRRASRSRGGNADDARFMQLALALGRRGLGNTWPNPAVGAVIVKDGVILARGWTQPGGRPHAEVEALRRAKKAGARRNALCDAGALLASGQVAALRRRHHQGRHRARGLGAGRPQSGSGRARAMRGCARRASRSRSGSAPKRRAARMPATSRASRKAVPM